MPKPNSLAARIDDNIADRAITALWQDPFLDPTGLQVRVTDGVVTLLGADLALRQIADAIAVLEELACVAEVRDGTKVTLPQAA